MIERIIYMSGEEFVKKLLGGEREFTHIRLEPYFNLSGNDAFDNLQDYLGSTNLEEAPVILNQAELRGLDADGLYLPYLKANDASFKHGSMMETDLRYSQFKNTDFRYARLPQIKMMDTDLENADLRQADLNLARLDNALLSGANLAGATLLFTNLQGANIQGIVNLHQARFVDTANFQFVSLTGREKAIIREELWAQEGKKRRLFGGTG